jgi:hypothetical protein
VCEKATQGGLARLAPKRFALQDLKTEKLAKVHADARAKILAILTDEQKAKERELAGPPFEGEIVFEEHD